MKVSEMTDYQLKKRYKELVQLNHQATRNRDMGMIGSVRRMLREVEEEISERGIWGDN